MKKILTILLAVAMLPCAMQVDAAKPKKSSSHKSSAKKSTHKSSSKSKKTVNFEQVRATESTETPADQAALANADNVSGETIVKTAMQYIGVPYRHGTSSPKSFDCSGFTSYVFKQYDILLSRCSRTQYTQGVTIKNKKDLRAGDLVFFQGRSGKGGVGHVGIVTEVFPSENTFKFVHASNRGVGVDKSTMSYYSSRYIGARRILTTQSED